MQDDVRSEPLVSARERSAMHGGLADADFLRSVLASCGDCLKVLDLDGRLAFMNEAGQRLMEVSDFNTIEGCPWPDFWADGKHLEAKAAVAAARAGGRGAFVGVANTMAGTPKWWDVQVTPILGLDAQPSRLLVISRDVTAAKLAEERQTLLMQELAHRVKNTLAVVQAMASQTLRGDGLLADARQAFTARLLALAQAHDLLLRGSWTETSLRGLVEGAVRLLGRDEPGRFRVEADDVTLGARAALSFALVLHELGTNAAKYGALSVPDGHVVATWWHDRAEGEPWLHFHWQELGGPPVTPPRHRGFGSRLIERSLTQALGGSARLEYPATGVTFTIAAPLAAWQQS